MTCKESFESHIRSLDGDYNLMMVGDVYIDVETQIEWRTWQKAWQAALASKQPADDGWVEWPGGECPLAESNCLEVKFRSGQTDSIPAVTADTYEWMHGGCFSDIIAYRVVKP